MKAFVQNKKSSLMLLIVLLVSVVEMKNVVAQNNVPTGAINGLFSVNSQNYQIFFSKGNLQYIGSASTPYWKFADNQWDYLGETTGQNSPNQYVDRDLFGWGTSGYHDPEDPYNVNYYPWSNPVSTINLDYNTYGYGPSMNMPDPDLLGSSANYDWGVYNVISNGGNQAGIWRTPDFSWLSYVLFHRTTTSGVRFAKANVNEVNGVILLPDDWQTDYYSLNNTNNWEDASYSNNTITISQWDTLEQHGAVFLPAAGFREGAFVCLSGSDGCYWTRNYCGPDNASNLNFKDRIIDEYCKHRYYGGSVRLVCPAQYRIYAYSNTTVGLCGWTSGSGTFRYGTNCTLTATAYDGYRFAYWTENGAMVSNDASYTFTVTCERTLVANFVPQGGDNVPVGAINSMFTVGENSQVYFSQGNLQYIGSAATPYWKFADYQWSYFGTTTGQNSNNQNVDRDLFGWATSGYNHGAVCYQPWSTNGDPEDHYAYGGSQYNLYDQTGKADWGYNAISNGGNSENMGWHTLTKQEWIYVFDTRNTESGIRYAKGKVDGVNGVILLPDNWSTAYYTLNNTNDRTASFSCNVISALEWISLEQYGAVFLPAAGHRFGISVTSGNSGNYWSSTRYGYIMNFWNDYLNPSDGEDIDLCDGYSVRLVRSLQNTTYGINVTPNPLEGGTVTGAGNYEEGTTCTLTATPNPGCTFVNWTKNGTVVSTNTTYSFTVTEAGDYVANFILPYFTIESLANNNTITFNIPQQITSAQLTSVSYSTDGINWITTAIDNTNQSISVVLDVNEKVYLKGVGIQYGQNNSSSTISSTGNIKVSGNAMSLLYGDDFVSQTEFPTGSTYTFRDLFYGNTHLVSSENLILPATTLVTNCYSRMFFGCTSLTSAPELPATTLVSYCYSHMFNGCTSLTTAPALPATTLSSYCYWSMFNGCMSLTTAPALPATTLASNCYYFMFSGCTSLTTAPDLPATTLVGSCYSSMFSGCTSLTIAPVLPAASLTSGCYSNMFSGCSSLAEITCLATDNSASYCTNNWLKNVASSGIFHKYPEVQNWPLNSPSGIPEGWTVIGGDHEVIATANPLEGGTVTGAGTYDYGTTVTLTATPASGYSFVNWTRNGEVVSTEATFIFTFTEAAHYVANFVAPYFTLESLSNNNTITFNIPGEVDSDHLTSVSYSTDGINWTTLTINSSYQLISVTLDVDEKLYLKGIGKQYGYEDEEEDEIYYCHISATGDFNACGNIMSLLYGDNFADKTNFPSGSDYTFYELFHGNSHLVSAGNLYLPATIMRLSCYEDMFSDCTSLTSAPELPATTLVSYCYYSMFSGCTSLTVAPTLPASSLYATGCYEYMFSGCTSLTSAPELPATTLASFCYSGMFSGCTSLTEAPELPATTLASDCYSNMFRGCTSLTTAPELPATTLASGCYGHMFDGCTSLTTAPNMPATSLASNCYSYMFTGCTSLLLTPDLPATTLADGCYAYMFFGCTSLTTVPELPAINLPNPTSSWVRGCYQSMFEGCNSLTTAPELPATILTTRCYKDMFKNCSSLNEITCLATVISATDCTTDWLSGVASTGTFHKNPEMLDWLIDSPSGIPEGWMVLGNRFEITATANPSEGGTITGTGMYDEGSAATLSATPNEGYFFVNWTENGEEVSTDATYSFTVTGDRTLVANFSTNNYHWTPVTGMSGSMTMLAILKIDGVQSFANNMEIGAFSGQECRGTALPQYYQEYCFYSLNIVGNTDGDPITFRLYDHHLNQELDLYCSNELNFVDGEAYGFDNFYEINFFNLVQITAMADPAEGGSTNGAGSYYNLSTCTLVAVANEGYSFQYWTLNDEVVSSDATYSFEVNGAADYVAHFSLNNYEISVTAQPTEGGSVSGNGTYNHFAICTLTAEANTGYTFESWTLNGEVVSNEPIYNFEVSSAANYVANFSPNNYEIVAIANPSNGGTIEGTGTYNHFQTCTLTATANEGYQFNSWIMDGVIVSTETTYSFVVSGPVTITAMFDVMQTVVLSQGWTWWGSSVELSSLGQDGGLSMLEESMNPNGRVIKTIDKFVHYQVTLGQWIGGLNRLTNEESYRIQTITPCTVSFTGPAAHPENHPINIHQYWNWIGYPVSQPQTVATALGNYQPTVNDVIKGQGGYATYLPDVGWMPQYFTLNPGQSYMYYSVNSENQTLVYANGRGDVPVAEPDHRHWRNDIHAFADNLCLMAVVTVDGVEQRSEELELGAFVNGECRGSARLLYIEPLDRYYAMMTVTGQDNEVVEFALIDMSHHQISASSTTRLTFSNDAICGTYDNPYTVAFGTMTAIEEHTSSMCLYPNPINRNETFNLVIPEDEEIVELTVVNASGAVVRRVTGAIKRHAVTGLSVTGLYMVRVVCKSGSVYHGRLMVD